MEQSSVFSAEEITAILFGKDPRFNSSLKKDEESGMGSEYSFIHYNGYVDKRPCKNFMDTCQDFFVLSSPNANTRLKIRGNLGIYYISRGYREPSVYDVVNFYLNPQEALEEAKSLFSGYEGALPPKMIQEKPFELLDKNQILSLQSARKILYKRKKSYEREREESLEEQRKIREEEDKHLPHITVKGCIYNLNTRLSGAPFVKNGRLTEEETGGIFSLAKGLLDANQEMTAEEQDHGIPSPINHLKYVNKEVGVNLEKFVQLVGSISPRKLTQGEFELLVDMIDRTFRSTRVYQKYPLEKKKIFISQNETEKSSKSLALSFLFSSWFAQEDDLLNRYDYHDLERIVFSTEWWLWSMTYPGFFDRTWLEEERLLPRLKKMSQQDLDAIYKGKFTLKP